MRVNDTQEKLTRCLAIVKIQNSKYEVDIENERFGFVLPSEKKGRNGCMASNQNRIQLNELSVPLKAMKFGEKVKCHKIPENTNGSVGTEYEKQKRKALSRQAYNCF